MESERRKDNCGYHCLGSGSKDYLKGFMFNNSVGRADESMEAPMLFLTAAKPAQTKTQSTEFKNCNQKGPIHAMIA